MGTLLAFMMAVVALSLPEMILLRRVLKPQLLGIYVAVVGAVDRRGGLPVQLPARLSLDERNAAMIVKILGPGCTNCQNLERATREALAELGLDATVEKVEDYADHRRLRGHVHPGPRGRREGARLRPGPQDRRDQAAADGRFLVVTVRLPVRS